MSTKFEISTIFKGVDRISKPLTGIGKSLRRFTRRANKDFRSIGRSMDKMSRASADIGRSFAVAGAAGTAGLAAMLKLGADFEQSITNAGTKFGEAFAKGSVGAKQLEDAARNVGATTEFTASMAAVALNNLGLAGLNAAQSMTALPLVIDLATVAEVELGEATTIATKTLGAFNLNTKDSVQLRKNLTRVTDVLAKTQNTSNVTMASMFETISTGAAVFQSAGVSIEDFPHWREHWVMLP